MRQRSERMSRTLASANPGTRCHTGCAASCFQRLKGECGNALIEYALSFMLFLTLLFGIAGFGDALYVYHFLSNGAREASRYAAVRGSTCNNDSSCSLATPDTGPAAPGNTVIQDYVGTIVPPGIDSSRVIVTPSWPVQANGPTNCNTTANAPGCVVEVQISYSFNFIFPLISTASLPMSSTSQMMIVH